LSRTRNVEAARWSANRAVEDADHAYPFGENVFSAAVQRARLPEDVFERLQATIEQGHVLDAELADVVAAAMKDWALEKGATHFSHWFQPLTGSTAEKHDSFYTPAGDGTAIDTFSAKELVQGEPDASSFPNGGIRQTFEARGYTAWDPTSPAFILTNPNGAVLCIPTAFASFTGEALDHKIPLLRSMDALSTAAVKALRALGDDSTQRVSTTVGLEQEYFLIDEQYFFARLDLVTTGRTLFGARPPRGQELDDHYFGTIPERVLACMLDAERELAKLGVPITTRHNEVAPGQFEVAPMFENTNVGCDHQQLTMQVLQNTARRYGLVCLLHEKPFAGVNGSGKHNNWSMGTDTGENLLSPGSTPHENLRFLFFCAAVIKAIDTHQGLLRASAASAGQDHRLGANEAPPAIISMFLGSELETIFEALARGEATAGAGHEKMGFGTPVLPRLSKHGADRNRTSPMAFTGNKFEFRMLGSAQSAGFTNTVLNTIVADAVDQLTETLVDRLAAGEPAGRAIREIVGGTYRAHGRIVFDGDGYSDAWQAEAAQRGLLNLKTTPDALPALISEETIRVFAQRSVLSARELEARYEVLIEQYTTKLNIEAETAAGMARTLLLPAAMRQRKLIDGVDEPLAQELRDELNAPIAELYRAVRLLEDVNADGPQTPQARAEFMRDEVIPAMNQVRRSADTLERLVADDLWPLPKYAEMLFIR
jgi:glutamine synthetase